MRHDIVWSRADLGERPLEPRPKLGQFCACLHGTLVEALQPVSRGSKSLLQGFRHFLYLVTGLLEGPWHNCWDAAILFLRFRS